MAQRPEKSDVRSVSQIYAQFLFPLAGYGSLGHAPMRDDLKHLKISEQKHAYREQSE